MSLLTVTSPRASLHLITFCFVLIICIDDLASFLYVECLMGKVCHLYLCILLGPSAENILKISIELH